MDKEKFDQSKYNTKWQKENMLSISLRYNKAFVLEFREALKKLGLSQSDVIRETMQEIIDRAKNQQ